MDDAAFREKWNDDTEAIQLSTPLAAVRISPNRLPKPP
jgi:hypothetical protein